MQNSKVDSIKQTHLFRCKDQRSQNHKKVVKDTLEGHNFVAREVPIHGLFNVRQCANASGELSGFSKGKNFSAGMNVMDYDIPELVVFIQEDREQCVKDICIDSGVLPPKGKGLSEDCEFGHNIIPCFFHPNMKSSSGSNLRTMEIMSTNSNGSERASRHPSIKDAMKKYGCRNLMMEGEVELNSGDKIPTDHAAMKRTSETLKGVLTKEHDISRSIKNWQKKSFLGTTGSRVEFLRYADLLQFTDATSMSTHEMGNSQSLTGSGKRQVDHPEETSYCALGPLSGSTSYTGPATICSSASHHQSNDSTSSTHSFAFPILPAEWNGSPIRMMEADKSQSRKQQWRKIWFSCCKC